MGEPPSSTKEKLSGFLSIFRPAQGYFITPLIIDLNILLFILMVISGVNAFLPDNESLLRWGANFRPVTIEGEWWRLLSSCFLHLGVFHLLMNMYALLYIGLLLEPQIGSYRFSLSYVVTGIAASITSIFWHDLTISAGASGAIFGLYGVFLSLLMTNLIEKTTRNALLTSIAIFVGYNLLYGMKDGIDNAAHIGGLLAGVIIGFSFFPSLKDPALKTRNTLVNSAAIFGIAAISVSILMSTSNPAGEYDRIMKQFGLAEQNALSFYRLPDNTDDDKYLRTIELEGIPNWERCRTLVNSLDSIEDLPAELKSRNVFLKKYCNYRITSFKLIKQALKEKTNVFDPQILLYNEKIDLIIRKMNGENIADSSLVANPLKLISAYINPDILYVLDGQPVENINNIDAESIFTVSILKPEAAFQLYGERGKNGAVIVLTKAP
jgi:rhomboid protease GluP